MAANTIPSTDSMEANDQIINRSILFKTFTHLLLH